MRLVARMSYSLCPAERSKTRGARQAGVPNARIVRVGVEEILATSQGLCREIEGGALGWFGFGEKS